MKKAYLVPPYGDGLAWDVVGRSWGNGQGWCILITQGDVVYVGLLRYFTGTQNRNGTMIPSGVSLRNIEEYGWTGVGNLIEAGYTIGPGFKK